MHIAAPVRRGREDELRARLEEMRPDPGGNGVLPFAELAEVHFGRLSLLPAAHPSGGPAVPTSLILTTNFDGDVDGHVRHLVAVAGDGLDSLFSCCDGYPEAPTEGRRFAYLRRHAASIDTLYVNYVGRTVRQVAREAELVRSIQRFLNEGERAQWSSLTSEQAYERIRERVAGDPELSWAMTPVPRDRREEFRRVAVLFATALVALAVVACLVLYPILLLVPALLIVVLWLHERGNLEDDYRPPNHDVRAREAVEDFGPHNQITAAGAIQRGPFRRVVLRAVLGLLAFGARNLYPSGHLAGVDTIHFARWVRMDSGRRVVFCSNYDGSSGSYQDDFILRVAFGLNLVFSNGRGWPRTLLLLFRGARDEQSFKAFWRAHQLDTQVWYRNDAYDGLTAVNVAQNARVRAGLSAGLRGRELEEWLRLL